MTLKIGTPEYNRVQAQVIHWFNKMYPDGHYDRDYDNSHATKMWLFYINLRDGSNPTQQLCAVAQIISEEDTE